MDSFAIGSLEKARRARSMEALVLHKLYQFRELVRVHQRASTYVSCAS